MERPQTQAINMQGWDYGLPPSRHASALGLACQVSRLSVWLLCRLVLRTVFSLRVRGQVRIPDRGPFVLVANHTSHVDTASLFALLPRSRIHDTHPLAARDYFFRDRLLGTLVRLLVNAAPIDREAGVEGATAPVRDLLGRGHGVICFPEGTRSLTGGIAPFKQGVGRLLAGKLYPAIPAAIVGAHEVLPKCARWPRLRPIEIVVGEPVSYEDETDTQDAWRRIAADLERRVWVLTDSSYTRASISDQIA